MAKNLVIVESPAKAKTINKYLGKDYLVKASIGHIKDLPSKGLGVDVDDDFKPTYEVIPDSKKRNNKKIVSELKKAAKEADNIYFAADPDREGEAICQHLAEEIVPKRPAKATFRVMFNEITKRAVNEAFEHPKQIDENLVDSQQARRVLDRLVGYKVSPLLCRTVGGKLSAGRVQSVALRMVVEREREIEKFIKTEYWTITANLGAKLPPAFDARLFKVGEQTVKTGGFDQDIKGSEILMNDEAKAADIVAEANQQTFVVNEVTKKERKAQSRSTLHHFEVTAGGRAQTGLGCQTDDDDCAEALRRHRDWRGRFSRVDHLHANRLDASFRCSAWGGAGFHQQTVWRCLTCRKSQFTIARRRTRRMLTKRFVLLMLRALLTPSPAI